MISGAIKQNIVFLPFFIFNLYEQYQNDPEEILKLCPGVLVLKLPCAVMYSRFQLSTKVLFPLTLIFFMLQRFHASIVALIKAYCADQFDNLQSDGDYYKIA